MEEIGRRIQTRRRELKLSLRDLARRTGLSATFLSTLERGLANPTLESLRKVTNALEIPLLRLTGTEPSPNPVVRHDRRRRLSLPPHNIEYEILTPSLTRKMVLVQVRASSKSGNLVGDTLPQPTEECLVLLSGHIQIRVASQTYDLLAGDSIYFEGRDLESIHVVGDEEAVYISAITPPVF